MLFSWLPLFTLQEIRLCYEAFYIFVSALQPLKPHAEVVLVTTLRCRYQNSLGKISLSFTITNNQTFKLMWYQYAITIIFCSVRDHGCKGWCAIYMHNWLLLIISGNEAKIKPLYSFSLHFSVIKGMYFFMSVSPNSDSFIWKFSTNPKGF